MVGELNQWEWGGGGGINRKDPKLFATLGLNLCPSMVFTSSFVEKNVP